MDPRIIEAWEKELVSLMVIKYSEMVRGVVK